MSLEKEPATKAPWPPKPSNDKFYRYPKPRPVGKEKGESFATIAKGAAVKPADLVYYNFLTKDPGEINWYLAQYVGCPAPKAGERYYSFYGAAHDPLKNTGVIFIPTFGSEAVEHANRLGERVVEDYNKSSRKEPGGRCYEACYARVKEASRHVGGAAVPALDAKSTFGRLWGSHIEPKTTWLDLPEEYRGKGAAGAMAWAGLGSLVEAAGFWAGDLKPGAVVQTWHMASDFDRVRLGDKPESYGHSFLFLNYVYAGPGIAGIAIADQGYQNAAPLVKGDYGYWVGANLVAGSAP